MSVLGHGRLVPIQPVQAGCDTGRMLSVSRDAVELATQDGTSNGEHQATWPAIDMIAAPMGVDKSWFFSRAAKYISAGL